MPIQFLFNELFHNQTVPIGHDKNKDYFITLYRVGLVIASVDYESDVSHV